MYLTRDEDPNYAKPIDGFSYTQDELLMKNGQGLLVRNFIRDINGKIPFERLNQSVLSIFCEHNRPFELWLEGKCLYSNTK